MEVADKPKGTPAGTFNGTFGKVDAILQKYGAKKAKLVAILQAVQEEYKYLPEEVMTYLGTKLPVSPATIFGVATFYSQFSLSPKGKYVIKICDGTACHVRGSMPVLNAIHKKLKLENGIFTTPDGLFTVETVSCLGACGLAPVVVINEKVYPQVTADAINTIINTLLSEER